MARPLRVEYDGAWYHVMNRGAGRQNVFLTDNNRRSFLDLLRDIRAMWNIEIHAYTLMDNHYHLLIHTPKGNLSRGMRHVNGVYTQVFNRSRRTDGPLFRGRYKAVVIEKENYLLELVRYIHLNPVNAGLCKRPSAHRWTSHAAYLKKKQRPAWLEVDDVLSHFSKRRLVAIRQFDSFVRAGVPLGLEKALEGKRLPAVIGSEGFVEWVKDNFIEDHRSNEDISEARIALHREIFPGAIIRFLCGVYSLKRKELFESVRAVQNEPRSIAAYLMRYLAGAKLSEIAREMQVGKPATVAKLLQRFRQRLEADPVLREEIERFSENLLSNVKT